MKNVLVLGGNGFVGKALQALVREQPGGFIFLDRSFSADASARFRTRSVDLLDEHQLAGLEEYEHAIWVAGSADHGLGWTNPLADLESQLVTLLKFLAHFRGSLTLLSSQAVYSGLSGEVPEHVDHVSTMPYGFAKLAAERYAQWALEDGRLERLWIHRLMYTFGQHEQPRRLLARCIAASQGGGTVTVAGGGRSFLNPLPVDFLAEVLLRSSRQLAAEPSGHIEVTNVNHPDTWTVLEVVEFLAGLGAFDYSVTQLGEQWPVTFHGRVERLSSWLREWDLAFPEVERSLIEYRSQTLGRNQK